MEDGAMESGGKQQRKRRRTFRDVHIVPIVASWLQQNYVMDAEGSIAKEGIYNSYVRFCIDNNLTPSKNNIFSKMLKKIFPQIRSRRLGPRGKGVPHYGGISPLSSSDSAAASVSTSSYRGRNAAGGGTFSSADDSEEPEDEEEEEEEEYEEEDDDEDEVMETGNSRRLRKRAGGGRGVQGRGRGGGGGGGGRGRGRRRTIDEDEEYEEEDAEEEEEFDDGGGSSSSSISSPAIMNTRIQPLPSSSTGLYISRSPSSVAERSQEDLAYYPDDSLSMMQTSFPSQDGFDSPIVDSFSSFSEGGGYLPPTASPLDLSQPFSSTSTSDTHPNIVMRLVQRFEELMASPPTLINDGMQENEENRFREIAALCDRVGLTGIKDAMAVVLNVRKSIQAKRRKEGSNDTITSTAIIGDNNFATSTGASVKSETSQPQGNESGVVDWLNAKQALEAAFSVLRREEGPGQRLVRMWVLSLLAEVQMLMSKESIAFRTGQLFMRTLEEAIAAPPLPSPPFGSGSMEFFDGIATVFRATSNELYLIRLISLLLHARQFDADLARSVNVFARKWNKILYAS